MLLARRLLVFALWMTPPCGWSAEKPADPPRDFEYIEMLPAFVVNVGSNGRIAFLKAEVTLRTSAQTAPLVQQHMPALRHELIMLFSRQDLAALDSPEQREALRLEALDSLRHVLAGDGIQDLLFTTFITQR